LPPCSSEAGRHCSSVTCSQYCHGGRDMFRVRYELDASQRYQWRREAPSTLLPGQVTERNVYATVQRRPGRRLYRGSRPRTGPHSLTRMSYSRAGPGSPHGCGSRAAPTTTASYRPGRGHERPGDEAGRGHEGLGTKPAGPREARGRGRPAGPGLGRLTRVTPPGPPMGHVPAVRQARPR